MHRILQEYIDTDYTYRFLQNPDVVNGKADALANGLNCVTLAHFAMQDLFNYELPKDLLFAEMYLDEEHFKTVESLGALQLGDLVWFGRPDPLLRPEEFEPEYQDGRLLNWQQFPVKHVAIFSGERTPDDDPILVHATYRTGTTCAWPLQTFLEYRWCGQVYGASRLKAA
jgi:hypothetical protein